MSAHKRRASTPLPIFNKNKCPRQALVAHPNNMGGVVQEAPHWKNSVAQQSISQKYGRYPQQVASTCPPKPQLPGYGYTNSENRVPHNTHQGGFTPFQKVQYTPGTNQCSTSHAVYSTPTPAQKPGSCFGSMVSNPNPVPSHTQAVPLPFTPHGLTQKTQGSRLDTSLVNSSQRPSPSKTAASSVRVLTATARGMEHWSKYKDYTHLLFEVFGVVSSPMSVGSTGAKEFTLKASDGVVKCLFWEIDRKLPHLVRGQMHRVVGQWDVFGQCLKCYSVRPVRGREEGLARSWVEASDRSMRQLVATIPEM